MANLQKILLVEDNPQFTLAAVKFLHGLDISVDTAGEYDSAIASLEHGPFTHEKFDGVITDCFFPRTLGSEDRTLGRVAIGKMLATDTRAQRIDEYEQHLAEYIGADPELRNIVRYIGSLSNSDPLQGAVSNVIKLIGDVDRKAAGIILKNDKWLFKGIEHFKDHYDALRFGMQQDTANQALGILVAEECEQRKIPFVLATSTYHHDAMTQPIQDYCGKRNWRLVDSSPSNPNEKAEESFWNRAYETLLREAGGRK